MQIAIIGANFTPDEADELRRALATFRHVGTISSFRERFLEGMRKNGYPEDFADRCFSQIEGFGTYGFPEAHAISFANLVYVSAWIKCHYPDVFCAALLNSQPMGFYAPAQLVRDAREHGVEVRPIDVNHSYWETTLEPVKAHCVTPSGWDCTWFPACRKKMPKFLWQREAPDITRPARLQGEPDAAAARLIV